MDRGSRGKSGKNGKRREDKKRELKRTRKSKGTNGRDKAVKNSKKTNNAGPLSDDSTRDSESFERQLIYGFDRGLEAEKIVAIIGDAGAPKEMFFVIKWKGTDETDLIPAAVANVRCPQVVIQYYQSRLTWQ